MENKTTEHALEGREFFQLLSAGKYENLLLLAAKLFFLSLVKNITRRAFLFYCFFLVFFFTARMIQRLVPVSRIKHLQAFLLVDLTN